MDDGQTASRGISVLVLSAYRQLREAVGEMLGREGIEVVGESASGNEALDLVGELCPQVAIIDELLADGDARAVCRALEDAGAATRCVVLTSWDPAPAPAPRALPGNPVLVPRRAGGSDLADAVRTAAHQHALTLLAQTAAGRPAPAGPVHRDILAMLEDLRAHGSPRLAVLADTWEPAVLRHPPSSPGRWSPCAGCGGPWPCPVLLDVVRGLL